ncbi:MAG TPA: endonuclease III [Nitriliruptorales bacterium]|nr:endonuclease III [Nitriliruptorales bacterium]
MPDLHRDAAKARRAPVVLDRLADAYPDASIALRFSDPWELLVATILSAQCTDKKVNEVTASFFPRYPGPRAVAAARLEDLEQHLRPTGFFRQKARNIQAAARAVLEGHDGAVPRTMAELTQLPGVARKTANVVLSNAFGTNEGVVVDTHVGRIAQRLGFTRSDDPVRIERDLATLYPRERWLEVSDLLIHHGRRTCTARNPRCGDCAVEQLCPSSQVAGRRDRYRSRRAHG